MGRFRSYCPTCEVQTEERHNYEDAKELTESHRSWNPSRQGCDPRVIPVCWVCMEEAEYKHRITGEFVCEEHSLDIDYVKIE